MTQSVEPTSILEVLVKTHYHTVTDRTGEFGFLTNIYVMVAGFMVQYKNVIFFCNSRPCVAFCRL